MKSLLLLASLVSLAPTAAFAHHQPLVRETCDAYRHTEKYKPGHFNPYGNWIPGQVVSNRVEIPCSPYGGGVPVAHHPHYTYAPVPMPQQQAQPLVGNNQAPARRRKRRCREKVARMGFGGILGGLAGRYAVGGKKSKHTILGTTIGAAAGSLIGRATC